MSRISSLLQQLKETLEFYRESYPDHFEATEALRKIAIFESGPNESENVEKSENSEKCQETVYCLRCGERDQVQVFREYHCEECFLYWGGAQC